MPVIDQCSTAEALEVLTQPTLGAAAAPAARPAASLAAGCVQGHPPVLVESVGSTAATAIDITRTAACGGLVAGDRCPANVYLARLAPTGRRVQAAALARIADLVSGGEADAQTLPWGQLRYAHSHAVRAHLGETYAPATANRMLAALRGVLREAWRLGQMTSEEYTRAVDLPAVRGERLPAGRAVSAGELAALFASCGSSPGGVRDAALIAVLYGTGVRRSEAVALDLADVDLAAGSVTVRHGKGGKARITYLPAGAVAAVTAWLELRGAETGPLFWPVRRGGHLQHGRRMSGQAIREILHRRAATANVAALGPHDCRRSAAGDMLEAGADISIVARILGHSSITTTAGYDRRPEAAKARAAGLLHVPYTAPGPSASEAAADAVATAC